MYEIKIQMTADKPDSANALADPQEPDRSSLACLSDVNTLPVSTSDSVKFSLTGVILLLSNEIVLFSVGLVFPTKR